MQARQIVAAVLLLAAAGTCVLMVTHERDITGWVQRTVTLADGRILSPSQSATPTSAGEAVPC